MVNGSGFTLDDDTRVSCHICETQVPLSEAISPEGEDYMLHFCGMDCFARWYRQAYGRDYTEGDQHQ